MAKVRQEMTQRINKRHSIHARISHYTPAMGLRWAALLFTLFFINALPSWAGDISGRVIQITPVRNGIRLNWDPVPGASGYTLYRSGSRFGEYVPINSEPVTGTSLVDQGYPYHYYKLSSWHDGTERDLSAPCSLEMELFGENTLIFSPDDSREAVLQAIEPLSKELSDGRNAQFTNRRHAILFKPGNYEWLHFENGFYMQVAGLGLSPEETKLDRVSVNTDWLGSRNATCNFWRILENLTLLNKAGSFNYGVSQAAPLRRMVIHGTVRFDMGGWASGGYLANSLVTDTAGSSTQQQFFLRNNALNYFHGVNWNLVSVGSTGTIEPKANRTIIEQTPVVYEKPFLYFRDGRYFVFVPSRRTDERGTSWGPGKTEEGNSLPLDQFYVAHAARDNASTLNRQLRKGKHLLFTPGIYKVTEPLRLRRPHTILLGLGLATIQPTRGNSAMLVDDVEGIRIAGLIFDAGSGENNHTSTGGSPVLLQVGQKGSSKVLNHIPIVLSDLFFRVGGVDTEQPCRADVSLEINAPGTIGDHFWIWRADHGKQVAWEKNKADYGLIVNGDDVTIYGLFTEHYQKYDTYWTGNNGRMYFYQNEKAYDVPTQKAWIGPDGNGRGWAAYRIGENVPKHEAWGVGVYSVFINTKDTVLLENAILAPAKGDITIHYPFTVLLSTKGGIEHIINGVGGPHTNRESRRGSLLLLPPSYGNLWKSE